VAEKICTGCGLCVPVCPTACITLRARDTDPDVDACWDAGARALEIHTGAAAEAEIKATRNITLDWQARGGLLSYSLDGRQLGYPRTLALARELGEAGVIIQADGKPISGTTGDRSTIPALRLARAILRLGTGAWVQPSGGANDRTGPLASRHGIAIGGVGMGSFARRAAKALEAGEDSPEAWGAAVVAARSLVRSVEPATAPV
jgi:ferredoxin